MTESTSSGTHGRFRTWWTTRSTEGKAGVISVVIAAVTLVGSGVGWGWGQLRTPETTPPGGTAPPPQHAAATTPATAPTTAAAGRHLADLERIAGVTAALPDELDPAKYPNAVIAECPSNQTGDTSTSLTYDLDRRYRTFTAEVSGWADTTEKDAIAVRVFARVKQKDDTFVTTQQSTGGGYVNEPARPLTAKVKDANELVLTVECHRPGGVVIFGDARVHN